jgi:hypothetical protein
MQIPSMAAVLGFSLDPSREAHLFHLEAAQWKLQHVDGYRVDSVRGSPAVDSIKDSSSPLWAPLGGGTMKAAACR